jgi:hypothetical protein
LNVQNRIALVTGGTHGIGRAIVDRFLKERVRVATVAREAPNDLPSEVAFLPFDLADTSRLPELVPAIENMVGPLDILVNNAGMLGRTPGATLAQGNSDCAHFCNAAFGPGRERGQCKSAGARGAGACAAFCPNTGEIGCGSCAGGGGCVPTVEGPSVCIQPVNCDVVRSCASTAECDEGEVCAGNAPFVSCSNVCRPICGSTGAAGDGAARVPESGTFDTP